MYQPIENYGLIGNMQTAALVGKNGSIDWLCIPYFDSPSVFAAILDNKKGGRFAVSPISKGITYKQLYWPDTNVLITRFHCSDGVAETIDFMPVCLDKSENGYQIIRKVSVLSGTLTLRITCDPAFNYARDSHETVVTPHGACFHSFKQSIGLATDISLTEEGKAVIGDFILEEGQSTVFALQSIEHGQGCSLPFSEQRADQLFNRTVTYWRQWLSHCNYAGRWREMVHRSALVLKLLTSESSGAIIAAPTTSLPETIGGERNWDYRYVWIRDAAFTVYALMRIGFQDEAANFMKWIHARCYKTESDGALQQMYGINGKCELTEETLNHLEGYKKSTPVRIGNAAYKQLQLDIYGELMDSVYLFNKYGEPISHDLWTNLRKMTDWICDNWCRKDNGIWEMRADPRHHVYSKLMCWVALDRALRLAQKRSFPTSVDKWLRCRNQIYEEILEKGWSENRQSFVQAYNEDVLDAADLIMPLVFFMSPTDPRMLATIDAISSSPKQGGLTSHGLVYRYNVSESSDGLMGKEGTFNICSFWLVEALTRAGRTDRTRLEEARLLFEKMLGYANHLGLFAEQIGPCGEALGNFPQAFTHIALISAAYNLNRALGEHSP